MSEPTFLPRCYLGVTFNELLRKASLLSITGSRLPRPGRDATAVTVPINKRLDLEALFLPTQNGVFRFPEGIIKESR